MTALHLPWLEIAILLALLGAVGVSHVRDPQRVARLGTAFTGVTFLCTVLAWAAFALGVTPASGVAWGVQTYLGGPQLFGLDDLKIGRAHV